MPLGGGGGGAEQWAVLQRWYIVSGAHALNVTIWCCVSFSYNTHKEQILLKARNEGEKESIFAQQQQQWPYIKIFRSSRVSEYYASARERK